LVNTKKNYNPGSNDWMILECIFLFGIFLGNFIIGACWCG
jgi:hypothetical protein